MPTDLKSSLRTLTLGLLFVALAAQGARAQRCAAQQPSAYAGFVVSAVEIASSDPLFPRVRGRVDGLLAALPLQANSPFTPSAFDSATALVVVGLTINDPPEFYLPVSRAVFSECDTSASPGRVKITFNVSFLVPDPGSPLYERPAGAPGRRGPGWLNDILNVVSVQPYVGTTGTRNYAGAGAQIDLENEVVETLSVEGGGSASGGVGAASLGGERGFDRDWLSGLKWRAGYEHSDIPAGDGLDVKKGSAYGQLAATTRVFEEDEEKSATRAFIDPARHRDMLIRYGVSLEGGNRQSDLAPGAAPATVAADAGYGAVKTYVGGSWRLAGHRFKTSYGLQLGDTLGSAGGGRRRVDFLKHIFDAAYKTRFTPWRNRPVAVEAQFTAGGIDRRGVVPLAEQFFGGNVEQNFIAGDEWVIRAAPFIRSFPQRRLSAPGAPGGEGFVSLNFTFAATAWAVPAIPYEVQEQIPTAFHILKTAPEAAIVRTGLTSVFASETAGYIDRIAKAEYGKLRAEVKHLQEDLQGLSDEVSEAATVDAIDECDAAIDEVVDIVASAEKKVALTPGGQLVTKGLDASIELKELVKGIPPAPAAIPEVLRALDVILKQDEVLSHPSHPHLKTHRDNLQKLFEGMEGGYDEFVKHDLPVARARALQFLDDTRLDIELLGRELNAFALGPVFMFDAARVSSGGASEGFRYGVGPGVQVSFFGLEIRSGYSFNPRRRPGEPGGAFVFSFGLADLFQ